MLKIRIRVPQARDLAAALEIRSGFSKIVDGIAVASACPELASKHGNRLCDPLRPWGHPPFGTYRLLAEGPAPAGCAIEYGDHLLVFQPESGAALEAESFGRLLLLMYAGPTGSGGRLRYTQGGLRLPKQAFTLLRAALASKSEADLEIGPLPSRAWWRFWQSAVPAVPIAADIPKLSLPPLDELSLARQIAGNTRLPRRHPLQESDDPFRAGNDTGASSSNSSDAFSGGGGSFGGAGASGGWDSRPGTGKEVDSAGRIAAGVGVATGAVLLAASMDASMGASMDAPGSGQTTPSGNGDSEGDTGTQSDTSY